MLQFACDESLVRRDVAEADNQPQVLTVDILTHCDEHGRTWLYPTLFSSLGFSFGVRCDAEHAQRLAAKMRRDPWSYLALFLGDPVGAAREMR